MSPGSEAPPSRRLLLPALAALAGAALLVAAAPDAEAGALCEAQYLVLPAPVGTAIPARTPFLVVAPQQALASGDVLRITFPAGTTFTAPIAPSDLEVRQVGAAAAATCTSAGATSGAFTAPSAVAVPATVAACSLPPAGGSGCPTLDLTLASGSLASGANTGLGKIVVATTATGGGKIRHPPTQDAAPGVEPSLTIETRRSGSVRDGPVTLTGAAVNLLRSAEWPQYRQSPLHNGLAPLTDVANTGVLGLGRSIDLPGEAPQRSSAIVSDLDGDGDLDLVVPSSVGDAGTTMDVFAYEGDGLGGFVPLWQYTVPFSGCFGVQGGTTIDGWANMAAADLDGDRLPEVVLAANYVTNVQNPVTCHDPKALVLHGLTGAVLSPVWDANPGPCAGMSEIGMQAYPAVGDVDGIPGNEALVSYFRRDTGDSLVMAIRWDAASSAYACPYADDVGNGATNLLQSTPVLVELRSSHPGLEVVVGNDEADDQGEIFLCEPTPTSFTSGGTCQTNATCSGIRGISAGDLDADGIPDVAVAGRRSVDFGAAASCGTARGSLAVFRGSDVAASLATAVRYDAAGGAGFGAAGEPTSMEWTTPAVASFSGTGGQVALSTYDEYPPTSPYFNLGANSHLDVRGFSGGITCPAPCQQALAGVGGSDARLRGGSIAVDMAPGSDRRPEQLAATRGGSLHQATFNTGGAYTGNTAIATAVSGFYAPPVGADIDGDCRANVVLGDGIGSVAVYADGQTVIVGGLPTFVQNARAGLPDGIADLQAIPTGDPAYRTYFRIDNPPAGPSTSDTIYAGGSNAVRAGAFRFTAFPGPPAHAAGTRVLTIDGDLGLGYATDVPVLRLDNAPAGLGTEDTLYADADGDGRVSSGDFRFTAFPGPPALAAGTTVTALDADAGAATAGAVRVDLSWSAPTANGAPLTAYKVYRGLTPAFTANASNLLTTLTARSLPTDPFPATYVAPPTAYTDVLVEKPASSPSPGTRYYYRVMATNCMGEAPASNRARGDVIVAGPVTGLRAVPSGDPAHATPLRVTLTWLASPSAIDLASPNYNQACPWLEGYRVYRATGGGPSTLVSTVRPVPWPRALPAPLAPLVDPGPFPLTYTDTAVSRLPEPGNVYTYRVAAVNCVGEAWPAAADTILGDVRTPDGPVLATPRPSDAPAYSGGLQVRLDWATPAALRGCGPTGGPVGAPLFPATFAQGYKVYRTPFPAPVAASPANLVAVVTQPGADSPPGPNPWPKPLPPAIPAPAVALSYVDAAGLAPGSRYNYAVAAVNCVGEGPLGPTVTADLRRPLAPATFSLAHEGDPAGPLVNVSWPLGSTNNANCASMEGFRVHRAPAGGSWPGVSGAASFNVTAALWPRSPPSAAPPPTPTWFIDDVAHGVYDYRVSAVNCAGESPPSATLRIAVGPNLAPVATTALPPSPPTATPPSQPYALVPNGGTYTFAPALGSGIAVADPDALSGDLERLELSVSAGTLRLTAPLTGIDATCGAFAGAPPAPPCFAAGAAQSLRIRGTIANLTAALDGLRFDAAGTVCDPPDLLTTVRVTIHDEGRNGHLGAAGGRTHTLSIGLFCADPPTFQAGGGFDLPEDTPAQAVAGWATNLQYGSGAAATAIRFLVATDNPGLFADPPTVDPSAFTPGLAGGTLRFRVAPDLCGAAHVEVRLQDNGGVGTWPGRLDLSVPHDFTVNVRCVNDPPTYAPGPAQIDVDHDAGPQVVAWGTAMAIGPAAALDETLGPAAPAPPWTALPPGAQRLRWEVSATNSLVYAVGPQMAPGNFAPGPWTGGSLAFTPGLGRSGISVVTVCLRDDGGIADGGVDRACSTFRIRVHGPPTAHPDCYATAGRLFVDTPGVLVNDEFEPDLPVTVELAAPPLGASSFLLRPDGSFEYVPAPSFSGDDLFTYRARQAGYPSSPTTVCVHVVASGPGMAPEAAFTVPEPVVAGLPATFSDHSTDADGAVVSWAWSFDDGAEATGRTVSHVFAAPGTYRVVLTVTDDAGLVGVKARPITVVAAAGPAAGSGSNASPPASSPSPTAAPPPPPPAPSGGSSPAPAGSTVLAGFTAARVEGTSALAMRYAAREALAKDAAWDFGDGQSALGLAAVHSYAAPGDYAVTLAFRDAAGQAHTFTEVVRVEESPQAGRAASLPGAPAASGADGAGGGFPLASLPLPLGIAIAAALVALAALLGIAWMRRRRGS